MGGIHTRQKKAPFHGARSGTRWVTVKGFNKFKSSYPPFQSFPDATVNLHRIGLALQRAERDKIRDQRRQGIRRAA